MHFLIISLCSSSYLYCCYVLFTHCYNMQINTHVWCLGKAAANKQTPRKIPNPAPPNPLKTTDCYRCGAKHKPTDCKFPRCGMQVFQKGRIHCQGVPQHNQKHTGNTDENSPTPNKCCSRCQEKLSNTHYFTPRDRTLPH